MTHASHNATNSNSIHNSNNEETTMSTTDTMINTITAAIAAANARSDERYAAVAASRGSGSSTPNWLACDDLQAVLDELEAGEDWDVVADEIELADAISDAIDLGVNADQVKEWTVLVRVHSGEFVTPSDPREYVIVWRYDDVIDIDLLLEWGDNYDGDLPDLDPDDYDGDDELDDADYERRRQYWRLTGRVATSRVAWLREAGADADEAEAVSDRFRALCPDLWPIDCHLSYERGDGHADDSDSIEGAGRYAI